MEAWPSTSASATIWSASSTREVALTKEDLGIAVLKGNTELLTKIDDGLTKIKANGKFAEIYEKWFGKQPPQELLQ